MQPQPFALKPACCYVAHNKLVYAALVDGADELLLVPDETGSSRASSPLAPSPPLLTVTSRAYNSHSPLHKTSLSGPLLLLEGLFGAPLRSFAPLSVGDLVVGSQLNRHKFGDGDPSSDWNATLKRARVCRVVETVLDPYDSTIPAHIVQSMHLFRITRMGPLDVVRAMYVTNLEDAVDAYACRARAGDDELDLRCAPLASTTTSAEAHECRFKRCELRKVVSSLPLVSASGHSSLATSKKKEQTGDKVRRLLMSKLLTGGGGGDGGGDGGNSAAPQLVAESPMVEALRAANVRLTPSGSGIGHSAHSSALTLEDLTDF